MGCGPFDDMLVLGQLSVRHFLICHVIGVRAFVRFAPNGQNRFQPDNGNYIKRPPKHLLARAFYIIYQIPAPKSQPTYGAVDFRRKRQAQVHSTHPKVLTLETRNFDGQVAQSLEWRMGELNK